MLFKFLFPEQSRAKEKMYGNRASALWSCDIWIFSSHKENWKKRALQSRRRIIRPLAEALSLSLSLGSQSLLFNSRYWKRRSLSWNFHESSGMMAGAKATVMALSCALDVMRRDHSPGRIIPVNQLMKYSSHGSSINVILKWQFTAGYELGKATAAHEISNANSNSGASNSSSTSKPRKPSPS